ncbi:hypothetical protein SKAU_G00256550 [Synaphobranchus kaupii]|uniref:Uncharacterized protein n=1 Tax=Synaphobranchus kaupii TaxID=118154 RepID=A0A9Q1ISD7_SYNKA|nr:hypothetical protein SKAU_G00256550 [Synaphobranchus kaupii]
MSALIKGGMICADRTRQWFPLEAGPNGTGTQREPNGVLITDLAAADKHSREGHGRCRDSNGGLPPCYVPFNLPDKLRPSAPCSISQHKGKCFLQISQAFDHTDPR